MQNQGFKYESVEAVCSDLKIIFITDECAELTGQTGIHMHSFWELIYIMRGNCLVNCEQSQYNLYENQAIVISPNMYHNTQFSSDAIKKSIFFTFYKVKTPNDEKLYDAMQTVLSSFHAFKLEQCEYIGLLLSMILKQETSERFANHWRIRANITELIFTLFDETKKVNSIQNDNVNRQNTYYGYKYAIDRLMDEHYANDISLEFLSEQLHLSPQNVTKIISAVYGKSFTELKLELKMRNAKKMLVETQYSVNEIGNKIGYTSTRGFLSAFLKYEGCTPSEYRKNNR